MFGYSGFRAPLRIAFRASGLDVQAPLTGGNMFSQRFSKPTNSASLDFVSLDIVLLLFMCMHIKSSSTMSRLTKSSEAEFVGFENRWLNMFPPVKGA